MAQHCRASPHLLSWGGDRLLESFRSLIRGARIYAPPPSSKRPPRNPSILYCGNTASFFFFFNPWRVLPFVPYVFSLLPCHFLPVTKVKSCARRRNSVYWKGGMGTNIQTDCSATPSSRLSTNRVQTDVPGPSRLASGVSQPARIIVLGTN
jgi:hypothetical protein